MRRTELQEDTTDTKDTFTTEGTDSGSETQTGSLRGKLLGVNVSSFQLDEESLGFRQLEEM